MAKASERSFQRSVAGYDRLAPIYESLETLTFGTALQKARTALIGQLPPFDHALILGEGDGRFLQALLRAQPRCTVTCVEQSPRMVELAHRRLARAGKLEGVNFVIQDVLTFTPLRRRYDAVFTSFFLDCFTEEVLSTLIPRLLQGLKRGGLWYYSDFHMPGTGLAKLRAEVYLRVLHGFFRWQTGLVPRALVDPHKLFLENGLRLERQQFRSHRLLVTRLYRF